MDVGQLVRLGVTCKRRGSGLTKFSDKWTGSGTNDCILSQLLEGSQHKLKDVNFVNLIKKGDFVMCSHCF